MDFLTSPQFFELLNGANGVLLIFIIFATAVGWGGWNIVKFIVISVKEIIMTVNETLQEIKSEISNLSTKVEKLSELPNKVEVLSGRLEAIEDIYELKSNRRGRR
jgi:predicted PurR-regulated permease PerM